MRLGATIVKLVILSLIVGFALHTLNIRPEDLLNFLGDTVAGIFRWLVEHTRDAVPYILTGAAVVVPIWLVFALLRMVRGRKNP